MNNNWIKRKKTKAIKVGDVLVGGGNPITIQSMTNTNTCDVVSTVKQIKDLEAAGAEVTRVEAYETKTLSVDPTRILSDLNTGVDVVTFASPSAVETMASAMDDGWSKVLQHCSVVAIGATTRDALVAHGAMKNAVSVANPATFAGLVEATVSSSISTPMREHER